DGGPMITFGALTELQMASGELALAADLGGLDLTIDQGLHSSAVVAQHLGTLSLADGASLALAPATGLLSVTRLSVASGAVLDLSDNDLILDYSGTPGAELTGIQSLIASARSGGTWLGAGITSTAAGNNPQHNTTLGVMEATDYDALHGGPNSLF